ncbi:ZIP family metal transporter [Mucilaginibacter mallensis]|nr:ZIP family metal transporter [Mucilaginibacter mallensis]
MILLICIATFLSTLMGGLLALRFQSKLYLILGFSAGAVIGVAFFDLLPTAIELASKTYGVREITSMAGFGFVVYLLLDRLAVHFNQHKTNSNTSSGSLRGKIAALCLTLHSFLDGVAIGLAFHLSLAIGSLVAVAVLVHDFADGINTTNVILKENGSRRNALKWLITNAIAPLLGALSTLYYKLPAENLGLLLALISGFFLYIGASDFLPESRARHPKLITLFMTILGILTLYMAIRIAEV